MDIKKIILGAAVTFIAATTFISGAEAKGHVQHIKTHHGIKKSLHQTGGVLPPFAYIQFCVHHASSCRDNKGRLAMASSGKVKMTSKLQSQLASVNSRVNSRMKPVSDKGSDRWAIGGKSGDCEDFALTKRAMLIAAGWPSRALSMTVVKTAWGEGHAVLSVHTSSGTVVLDNLSHSVRPISSTPYRIVAMQGGSSLQWVRRNNS
jgi:predicted transglutaminase-like cysteine proteinase